MPLVDPDYVDDGALREQDRVDLEDFLSDMDRAELGERGVAFFSGRETEITAFRRIVNRLSRGRQGNATIVVEGPPGAGKSALLAQFQEEISGLPPTESGQREWLPVFLPANFAEAPKEIARAIDRAISVRLADRILRGAAQPAPGLAARFQAAMGPKAGIKNVKEAARKLAGRGGGAFGMSIGPSPQEPIASLGDAVARRAEHWSEWQIVLLIDEAQQISDQRPGDVSGTLSSIHQGGVPAPISFCSFGLPGTWAALEGVNVSRSLGGADLRVATLDESAARKAVNRCFEAFEVRNAEAWQQAIVERSANWPQHLATYLVSAMAQIRRQSAGKQHLDASAASLAAAMAIGDEGRNGYYARRFERLTRGNGHFQAYAETVVMLFRKSGGQLSWNEIKAALQEHDRSVGNDEVNRFTTMAEHSGLMRRDPSTPTYQMPIPSFAGYLLNEPLPEVAEPDYLADEDPCRDGEGGLSAQDIEL
ncbi:MAG: ATP-binding protein [Gammaproteobacteria bacterium]|nr:ATP-binding protein [Gammaproteobacteria bacterium]MDE0271904.1 ATP-binding protein [Gammaproteobacteria bacterium]